MRQRTPTVVAGVLAGHATHPARTGVTVLLFEAGARAGVHVPGSATGTRELGVLAPGHLAPHIHGICLAGGSAFGLSAADGVLAVLEARGVGLSVGDARIPLVPAAILYDLHTATARPDAAMGAAAASAASAEALAEGRVGAGAGAQVASVSGDPQPGGIGCWAEAVGAFTVAAVVAVNALGSVRDPSTGRWIVGGPPDAAVPPAAGFTPRGQTTLAVVVTDAPLDREACTVVAKMAAAGFARTLYPAFTPFDGDVVFAVSTTAGGSVDASAILGLGDAAATAVATAILRGVAPTPGEDPQAEER